MNCPLDNTPLVMSERSGIEIDYCPQCRGMWLDRGELDKIIDRSAEQVPTRQQSEQRSPERQQSERPFGERRDGDRDYNSRKRGGASWIGELFG
jgi:Zn-finger nucleic acid-binding protein